MHPTMEEDAYRLLAGVVAQADDVRVDSFTLCRGDKTFEVTDAESAIEVANTILGSDGRSAEAILNQAVRRYGGPGTDSMKSYGKKWSRIRILCVVFILRHLMREDIVDRNDLFGSTLSKLTDPCSEKTVSNIVTDLESLGALGRKVKSLGKDGKVSVIWRTSDTESYLRHFEHLMNRLPDEYLDKMISEDA